MSHINTHLDQVLDLSRKLLDTSVGPHHHGVVLEALLRAYVAVATSHTCSTQAAANGAMQASMQLAHEAAKHRTQIH